MPDGGEGRTALDGVGHGSLLAGRYRLQERVRTGPDGSLWRAVDETLDRPVSVRVVRPGHRFTEDVVDAARRAALVEDHRLARVLDVGEADGSAYIVAEHLVGRTLEELLAEGPLPAEAVRRLVGEAAQALDRASARGLHHLRLTPASLVVGPDISVKVLGTAVEAALAGVEQDEDPVGADRADAVGLVRLLYAGLTGRWPGPAEGPLGPAPATSPRVTPPGDLVAGIPNDLDTLCAVTLGPHDDGPASPGDLARQLAPWGLPEVEAGQPATPEEEPAAPPDPVAAWAGAQPDAQPWPGLAAVLEPESAHRGSARHATPAAGVAAGTAMPAEASMPTLLGPTPPPAEDLFADRFAGPSMPAGGTAMPGAAASSSSADDWAMLSRPQPVQPVRRRTPESEPLGPFMPQAPISRPPRDQARLVIALVAGLVVLGLVLAVLGIRGLTSSAPLVRSGPASRAPSSAPASPTAASGAAPSASTAASPSPTGSTSPSASPATISGIGTIDPQGDGTENNGSAPNAIDGDQSTTWRSNRYASADFGGLKHGVGLYLRLSGGTVTSVTVSMPGTGGTVELRTATGPGLDGSEVVATATASGGTAVLKPTTPVTAEQLLLWFTSLPQQSNGEYRLVVSEISVS